jgi:phenylpropionate dioxygenase-like ring-hydroxylating dioxygenase large terminal subunit
MLDVAPPVGSSALPEDFVPKAAYLSAEFHQLEKQKLWPKCWLIAGREEEVAKTGDYITLDIADETILILRDQAGVLRAFYNVCQHRGRKLLAGCGRTAMIFCKYHGWRWKLDGTNEIMIDGSDWDKIGQDDVALKTVAVDTWGGYVFVNPDSKAEPLQSWLDPFLKPWEPYRMQEQRYTWFKSVKLDCNWKVALEAFIEAYHAQTAHRQNNPASGSNQYDCRIFGRHSMYQDRAYKPVGTPTPNAPFLPPIDPERFRDVTDLRQRIFLFVEQNQRDLDCMVTDWMVNAARRLPERVGPNAEHREVMVALKGLHEEEAAKDGVSWKEHLSGQQMSALGVAWHFFPNVVILPSFDGVLGYRARPNGDDPDKCFLDVWAIQRFAPGKNPKFKRDSYERWNDFNWPRIFAQDFENVAEVQLGMKSAGFNGSRTNPLAERTVWNLHREIYRLVVDDQR